MISASIVAGIIGGAVTMFTLMPVIKDSFGLNKKKKESTVSSVDLEFEVKSDD